jgi:tryptophan synthase alpha chain
MLARETRGFLYYVSLTGVTGAREGLADDIEEQVARIRETSDVPVCVGFGVSTPEHSTRLGRFADGVVVGSALVNAIAETSTLDEAVDAASRFVTALKAPLKK